MERNKNMIKAELSTYTYLSNRIRVVKIDGELWFVASDVCMALRISNASMACSNLSQTEVKHHRIIEGRGRANLVISESGLYKLIFSSKLLAALGGNYPSHRHNRNGHLQWPLQERLKMQNEITPIVTIKNAQAVTTSRDVAEFFGKEHFNILKAIRGLDMPSDLKSSFFHPATLLDHYQREIDGFEMTRDGFTLLAMGFTGKKVKYIAQFNAMEERLQRPLIAH